MRDADAGHVRRRFRRFCILSTVQVDDLDADALRRGRQNRRLRPERVGKVSAFIGQESHPVCHPGLEPGTRLVLAVFCATCEEKVTKM